jgi:hypothetical protein
VHNFALIGTGGFVAPRHLDAIRDTGSCLLAAADPNDSVGVLDRYSFDVKFFREIERFDRFVEKARRGPEPNYQCGINLHFDGHEATCAECGRQYRRKGETIMLVS